MKVEKLYVITVNLKELNYIITMLENSNQPTYINDYGQDLPVFTSEELEEIRTIAKTLFKA